MQTVNADDYSDDSFWEKVKGCAKKAGKKVIEKALLLYYAAKAPTTPAKVKVAIYAALVYLIFPVDAIPDVIPGVGFSDDLVVLLGVICVAAGYITPEIREQTGKKMGELFGDDPLCET